MEKYITGINTFWFALNKEYQVIGTCGGLQQNNNTIKMNCFYINSKYRNLGIGQKLYDLFLNFAKKENYKEIIKGFTNAILKGLNYVHENDSKTIAENVLKFFPDTSLNDLTSAIDRYKKNDTWPTTTTFTKESFDHLQNIVIEAGFLDKKVEYDKLIYIK